LHLLCSFPFISLVLEVKNPLFTSLVLYTSSFVLYLSHAIMVVVVVMIMAVVVAVVVVLTQL
jgi:protein-S-isoprenylcysteine O-methyltransferase Ste14